MQLKPFKLIPKLLNIFQKCEKSDFIRFFLNFLRVNSYYIVANAKHCFSEPLWPDIFLNEVYYEYYSPKG